MAIFPLQKYYALVHIKFLTYTCSWGFRGGFSIQRVFPWYFDMLYRVIKIRYIVQFKNMIIKWDRNLSYYWGFRLNQPNNNESSKKLRHSLEFQAVPVLETQTTNSRHHRQYVQTNFGLQKLTVILNQKINHRKICRPLWFLSSYTEKFAPPHTCQDLARATCLNLWVSQIS